MEDKSKSIDQIESSLNIIFKEYDKTFTSFVSLSCLNALNSKKNILKHIRTIIADTLSDIILLKKIALESDLNYLQTINDVHKRVYDGVMLMYNHELTNLMNHQYSISVLNDLNLSPYLNILNESLINIRNIECEIKHKIKHSISEIKEINTQIHKWKSQNINSDFFIRLKDLLTKSKKLSLQDDIIPLLKESRINNNDVTYKNDTFTIQENDKSKSKIAQSAIDRYSNL